MSGLRQSRRPVFFTNVRLALKGFIMARQKHQHTDNGNGSSEQAVTPTLEQPNVHASDGTNGSVEAPASNNAVMSTMTPLEKARLARKSMVGMVRQVFYVVVGTTRDGSARDILGEGKSRRGAEKLADSMKAATARMYGTVEVWRCRKK